MHTELVTVVSMSLDSLPATFTCPAIHVYGYVQILVIWTKTLQAEAKTGQQVADAHWQADFN